MTSRLDRGGELALVWTGVLAGPIAWLVQLAANYALTERICRAGHHWPMDAVNGVCLAIVAAGWLAVWRSGHAARTSGDGTAARRHAFLVACGLGLGLLFTVVVAASTIPRMVIPPCMR